MSALSRSRSIREPGFSKRHTRTVSAKDTTQISSNHHSLNNDQDHGKWQTRPRSFTQKLRCNEVEDNHGQMRPLSGLQAADREVEGRDASTNAAEQPPSRIATMTSGKVQSRPVSSRQRSKTESVDAEYKSHHARHDSTAAANPKNMNTDQSDLDLTSFGVSTSSALKHSSKAVIPRPKTSSNGVQGHLQIMSRDVPQASQTPTSAHSVGKARTPFGESRASSSNKGGNKDSARGMHARNPSAPIGGLGRSSIAMASASEKRSKPQFSTYQQQFTPRKPSSVSKGQSGPHLDTRESLGRAFHPLQTELLHLCLLHRGSCYTRPQWEIHATDCLRDRFEAVVAKYNSILQEEKLAMLSANDKTLESWCEGGRIDFLGRKVQSLAATIQEISAILQGTYAGAVTQFLENIHSPEALGSNLLCPEMVRPDPTELGQDWISQVTTIARRLDRCLTTLVDLQVPLGPSNLNEIVSCHRKLVENMIQELSIMSDIQNEVSRVEREQRKIGIDSVLAASDRDRTPWKRHVKAW